MVTRVLIILQRERLAMQIHFSCNEKFFPLHCIRRGCMLPCCSFSFSLYCTLAPHQAQWLKHELRPAENSEGASLSETEESLKTETGSESVRKWSAESWHWRKKIKERRLNWGYPCVRDCGLRVCDYMHVSRFINNKCCVSPCGAIWNSNNEV